MFTVPGEESIPAQFIVNRVEVAVEVQMLAAQGGRWKPSETSGVLVGQAEVKCG